MASFSPFQPNDSGGTLGTTVAVTLNSGTLASASATITTTGNSILVTNSSTLVAFARFQTVGTPVATAADVPILAQSQRVFCSPVVIGATLYVAGIPGATLGAASKLYFTPGEGAAS